jgi:hypothetical protein
MKRSPVPFLVSLFFVLSMLLLGEQTVAFAEDKCNPIVKYDKTTGNVSLSGYGVTAGFGTKSNSLQVASDLTQIFDLYRVQTCMDLNKLKDTQSPEYQAKLSENLEATWRLAALSVLGSKGELNDADKKKLLESVGPGRNLYTKLRDPKKDDIKLEKHVSAANPEFLGAVVSIQNAGDGPACLSDFIAEQSKKPASVVLVQAVLKVAGRLALDPKSVRGYVFTLCSDNRLSAVPGLITVGDSVQSESGGVPRIPLNYGFVGIAYGTRTYQIDTVPQRGELMRSFTYGDDEAEQTLRRLLIEPTQKPKASDRWIIAVPLLFNSQIVGVMSFSGDEPRVRENLKDAYFSAGVQAQADKIASLLLGK